MTYKIIDLREELKNNSLENYKNIIKNKLEKNKINNEIINYILNQIENNNFDINSYDINIIYKTKIINCISKYISKYKSINDDIIRENIIKYNMTMFEMIIPQYLKIISGLYLRNELKTKKYFEIDDLSKKIIDNYDGKYKEEYINYIIFKTIIKRLCERFGENKIFCDEYTKQYSLNTFEDMLKNYKQFIKNKKENLKLNDDLKKKDFYIELNDFYYIKLLHTISSKKLPSYEDEILTILIYQQKNCELNIFFNVFFNYILLDKLDNYIKNASIIIRGF